jgi:hypothetical protein
VRPRPLQQLSLLRKPVQFQLLMDGEALKGLSAAARDRAIAELANLLLLAAGVRVKERDDEQRL